MIIFGENNEWGIDVDDGCLRFYPNLHAEKPQAGAWIWKEAWDKVEELGGFEAVRDKLYKEAA